MLFGFVVCGVVDGVVCCFGFGCCVCVLCGVVWWVVLCALILIVVARVIVMVVCI